MISSLTRREREQLRHREEILAAASAVFAEKGFHNTTVEDIAQASEFAIGSLYKHFKNKEAIFTALIEDRLSDYVDGLEAIASRVEPFPVLFDQFLSYYGEFANTNQSFFRLFMVCHGAMNWQNEGIKSSMQPFMERYLSALRRLTSRGREEGYLLPIDQDDLAAYVLGVLNSFFFNVMRRSTDIDVMEKLPTIRALILQGAQARADAAAPVAQAD